MNIIEAKQKISIPDLWHRFGFEGTPSKSCRCPFHPDRNASFSLFTGSDGNDAFKCFSGCGSGDSVRFYELATRLPHREACRSFIALVSTTTAPLIVTPRVRHHALPDATADARRATWPMLESPAGCEALTGAMCALAALRHVSLAGVELMAERGLLWFASWKGSPAWIVSDGDRVNAQARHMTGRLWPGIQAKAQTLPGSRASWPIGAKESKPFPVVLLCEGGPDLLAAHHFIHQQGRQADTAAVAVLGAGHRLLSEALHYFAGKRIRIVAHADNSGRNAAVCWEEQLTGAGAIVDASDLGGLLMADGSPVNDLNDLTRLHPTQTNELTTLIPAYENLKP